MVGVEELRRVKWTTMERNVVSKIRFLQHLVCQQGESEISDEFANEHILPLVSRLAQFCELCDRLNKLRGYTKRPRLVDHTKPTDTGN